MQAITIAIGKSGIEYFARELVAGKAVAILQGAKPADKSMPIPDFLVVFFGGSSSYSNFTVYLSNGKLVGFTPAFNQVKQLDSGDPAGSQFDLKLVAGSFSASYDWREKYHVYTCISGGRVGPICSGSDEDNSFPYGPAFGSLSVDLTLGFSFDSASKSYAISVVSSDAKPADISPNIPGKSALNGQESDGCLKTKVSDATASSLAAIDFKALIDPLFPPLIESIPASGVLTENVDFDFGLGSSGLVFPKGSSSGYDGIQIGVTGVASYKGQAYDATPAPDLPVPPVPADSDEEHINVYVSDWAINGLNWAYFKDGKLKVVVQPSDLPNPDALKVKTYASWIPSFKQYGNAAMTATITPLDAPLTQFQQVWEFTTEVMELLKTQLPADAYQKLQAFSGDGFVSRDDLTRELQQSGLGDYVEKIEKAAEARGMVTTQTMEFFLTIDTGDDPPPNLVFDVARVDIQTDLALGISGKAQTLQFAFLNVSNSATFKSTTVPGFDQKTFGQLVWPVVGESQYAAAMQGLGKLGVPIPIMQGFDFLFSEAKLSIQEGYVSILSQVKLESGKLPAATAEHFRPLRTPPAKRVVVPLPPRKIAV